MRIQALTDFTKLKKNPSIILQKTAAHAVQYIVVLLLSPSLMRSTFFKAIVAKN